MEEDLKITFNQWGKEFAQSNNCNPQNISLGLDTVYGDFLKKQQLDENGVATKIAQLNGEIDTLNQRNIEIGSENKVLAIENTHLQDKEKEGNEELVDLNNKILELEKSVPKKGDETQLNLYLIGSIVLGIAVVLSYSATFGSAMLGLEEEDKFIRANVFSDLLDLGTGNLVIAFFISFIPIVCGYIFGYYRNLGKQSAAIFALIITLLVDVFVGYKLTETIYNNQYQNGLHTEPWRVEFVLRDINFYIVLVLNFGFYFAFGWLLNAYFAEKELLNPDHILSKSIEQIENKKALIKEQINQIKEQLMTNSQKMESNKSLIETNKISIDSKLKDIDDYTQGKLPINLDMLKNLIGDFLSGYSSYTHLMQSGNAQSIDELMRENADKWWTEKERLGWRNTANVKFNFNNQ